MNFPAFSEDYLGTGGNRKKRAGDVQVGCDFLLIAIVAGFFGFTGVAGTTAYFAKIVFGVALVLLLVSLIFGRGMPRV